MEHEQGSPQTSNRLVHIRQFESIEELLSDLKRPSRNGHINRAGSSQFLLPTIGKVAHFFGAAGSSNGSHRFRSLDFPRCMKHRSSSE